MLTILFVLNPSLQDFKAYIRVEKKKAQIFKRTSLFFVFSEFEYKEQTVLPDQYQTQRYIGFCCNYWKIENK
ncbi:MAG: hypothetical protein R2852_06645 [Bacteroidia bacterium]